MSSTIYRDWEREYELLRGFREEQGSIFEQTPECILTTILSKPEHELLYLVAFKADL
jgi:hypothetical protein